MGRMYSVSAEDFTLGTAQIILQIEAASNVTVVIHEVRLTQTSPPTVPAPNLDQQVYLRFRGLSAAGTGGTLLTPRALDPGFPAADSTCRQGVGAGTVDRETLYLETWHTWQPLHYLPLPEDRPVIFGGTAFIVQSFNNGATRLTSFTAVFEEIG